MKTAAFERENAVACAGLRQGGRDVEAAGNLMDPVPGVAARGWAGSGHGTHHPRNRPNRQNLPCLVYRHFRLGDFGGFSGLPPAHGILIAAC
jgi:hypothetical protein